MIEHRGRGSLEGTLHFPDVLQALGEVGVTHYHADFLRSEKNGYLRCGESHGATLPMPAVEIAAGFSAGQMATAVNPSQQEGLPHPEFLVRGREAGCIGYVVYLDGRRVVFTDRTGEEHVEYFPPQG